MFVYGSLRTGASNHHIIQGARLVDHFVTQPSFAMLDIGGYPGVVKGSGSITGEIFRVHDQLLAKLDRFERCPLLYFRESLETHLGHAWIYLFAYPKGNESVIISGDWFKR